MICVRTKSKYGLEQANLSGKLEQDFLNETAEMTLTYAEMKLDNKEAVTESLFYNEIKKAYDEKNYERLAELFSAVQVFCCFEKTSERLTKIKVVGKADNVYYNRTIIDPFDSVSIKSIESHMSGVYSPKGDEMLADVI